MGYTRTFLTGFSLNAVFKLSSKGISLLKLFILARLLTPHDFGLFSLILISVSIVEVFTESGINTILVQSSKPIKHFLDTAWIFSIGRGVAIMAVMIGLSQIMPIIYQESQLESLLLIACFIPLIRGFINPAIISFYKRLDFTTDTLYRITLVCVESIAAIYLAFWLRSPLALILPMIVSAAVDVVISFVLVQEKPRPNFSWPIMKEILHSSKWLNGIAIVDYLSKNLDNILVGKFLGTTSLGFYQNAYATSTSITSEVSLAVIHASFPIYTQFADDLPRLRRAVIKVFTRSALLFAFPTLLLVMMPEPIILLLLGEQWKSVATFLPLLALAGYLQTFINIGSTVFAARKKFSSTFMVISCLVVTMAVGIVVLSPTYGLIGAALSVFLSRLIAMPLLGWQLRATLHEKSH